MKRFLFCLLVLVAFYGCLAVDRIKWLEIPVKEKGIIISVDYVAPGATSADVVQVGKRVPYGQMEVLKNMNPYDTLLSYEMIGDTVLQLVLCDTPYRSFSGRIDTVLVRID